jgi:hypothetical protein
MPNDTKKRTKGETEKKDSDKEDRHANKLMTNLRKSQAKYTITDRQTAQSYSYRCLHNRTQSKSCRPSGDKQASQMKQKLQKKQFISH